MSVTDLEEKAATPDRTHEILLYIGMPLSQVIKSGTVNGQKLVISTMRGWYLRE
jgi:hypothetical protein